MKNSYRGIIFEMSLIYGLLAISLPLVYAVTYHLSFTGIYSAEWLAVSLFLYPIVLLLGAVRYGYQKVKYTQLIKK
ncbi:hypothetical protein RV11_GL000094 [Enterococcus phoeniculicola]|jgi:hypothetical protein|uniref:Uncharacterized protein n=1 Tax=Enterococcus phoeniculicola ATCC BAA-412 TaxID=1158610 RepID=R3TWI4_9ENTE|nr:hypothetical protein [Enterococcus phoeniculicola]EOL45473.1 hypothetical protein UC3_01363 [Enterococcus phoeniculicola ATCC BAA-412]EOT74835.1 hypothetical protein I589_02435 [Enterococcus phoeniculicola ATCC BAA-412]OJG73728.1 hypothetical protein RV11_GL000094 [Enterococcus phoeniculicola]